MWISIVGISTVRLPRTRVAIPLIHGRTWWRTGWSTVGRTRWRRRSTRRSSTKPAALITAHHRCRTGILRHVPSNSGRTASLDERIKDGEDDETAHTNSNANNEVFMILDPASHGGSLALAAIAVTASVTGCTVHEVLIRVKAAVGGIILDLFGCAANRAARWSHRPLTRTGPGIVGIEEGAHDATALIVATRALPASTGEATAARGAVILVCVTGAGTRVSGAGLGNVAGICARAADRVGGCKLTAGATAVVGVIADGVVLELACLWVTASIATAVFLAATVTVFAGFDDAVAALAAADSHDSAVVGEAGGLDTVATNGGADVADGAFRKGCHAWVCVRVHDELGLRITSRRCQWATLGRDFQMTSTCRRITIMNCSKCVSGLVGEDLPCRALVADHNIRARHGVAIARGDNVGVAQSTHPGNADLLASRAAGHQGPVGVAVRVTCTPLGELVQSPGHISAIAANIPREGCSGRRGARLVVHSEIAQPDRDVE